MPANKNAMTRYMILDELLSNRYHDYSLDDLTEEVSRRLSELYSDTKGVVRRTIEKDIDYIENEGPFMAEIERKWVPYVNSHGKTSQKKCLRYKEPGFSIFKKELSDDEKYLLREALSLLGQFEGLPNLEKLEQLRQGLKMPSDANSTPVISFTKNPLENSNLLGELFVTTAHKQVIELEYHTFDEPDDIKKVVIHPYLLKEYNRRWFIIGATDSDNKIFNFSLDRIDKVTPLTSHAYRAYKEDISQHFEDIIGVTYIEDSPIYKIVFWADNKEKDYIRTKPIHESQRNLLGDIENRLRKEHPQLQGGAFFRIDCKFNYELIRELTSFGNGLIVLEPSEIRNMVVKRIKDMEISYNC